MPEPGDTLLKEKFGVTVMELTERLNDPAKYNDTLKKVCTLQSIENLSYLLRHLRSFVGAHPFNINIFREGISASWEDQHNVSGCSWSIQCKPEYSNALFERLSVYFIMKGFENFRCNGISANIRKNFVKFTIWSGSVPSVADGSDVLDEIGEAFGFGMPVEFIYKSHRDLVEKVVGSSSTNERE